MSEKKRILWDMDGILVNLLRHWLDTYNYQHDDDVRMRDITTWNMHEHVKIGKAIYKIPAQPGFFDSAPPMPGAIGAFKAAQKHGHENLICSSPYYNPDSARAKHSWCQRYLDVKAKDVTLTHKKAWLAPSVDMIIDDKPETIEQFAALGKEVITIAYPYNQSVEHLCTLRAQNMIKSQAAWEEITEYLTS